MTSRPITGELRDAMDVNRTYTMGGDEVSRTYYVGRDEFVRHCDAIDSIHANLERENASLKAELDRLMGEQECERPTPTGGITDELRKEARGFGGFVYTSEQAKHLTAIADRIDVAHKHAIGYVDDRDPDTMAENGWVRLPKDADGEYIHIGDVMEWPEDGETFEVVGIGDGWTLFYFIEDGVAECTRAENKRHHQPDTWERIIRDAMCASESGELALMSYEPAMNALVARCRALAGDAS